MGLKQGAVRLGVIFAEGGNDKLKIRRDADFEPKTGLSAPIPRPCGAPVFPLLSLARAQKPASLPVFELVEMRRSTAAFRHHGAPHRAAMDGGVIKL